MEIGHRPNLMTPGSGGQPTVLNALKVRAGAYAALSFPKRMFGGPLTSFLY